MFPLRRRLRFIAVAWILFQATTLSALVPRACCLDHQRAATEESADCHGTMLVHHCTMPDADGTPCPMHRGHRNSHQDSDNSRRATDTECAMRGTCGGPMAAVFALLSTNGVLTDSLSLPHLDPAGATLFSRHQLTEHASAPEAPPPRT